MLKYSTSSHGSIFLHATAAMGLVDAWFSASISHLFMLFSTSSPDTLADSPSTTVLVLEVDMISGNVSEHVITTSPRVTFVTFVANTAKAGDVPAIELFDIDHDEEPLAKREKTEHPQMGSDSAELESVKFQIPC
jgi:hypothetical protein